MPPSSNRSPRAARSRRGLPAISRRNLPLLLLQARECVLASFRPILNRNGVTEQQWRIVRALAETGPLEPRQIVLRCGISSPSLAGVLARMTELGLVQRDRLDSDLRRQHVSLTDTGRALITRMAPLVEDTYADIERRVGPERLQALQTSLDELISLMQPAKEATDEEGWSNTPGTD